MFQGQLSKRRLRGFFGIVLACGVLVQCAHVLHSQAEQSPPLALAGTSQSGPHVVFASLTPEPLHKERSIEAMAEADPIGFFQFALDRYDRSVRDYTCTFAKQELVRGKMSAEQVMNAMFREKPFSVRLEWVKNRDKCSRVLYVADRWVKDRAQMAVVEPGPIARLFVPYVMRAIDGRDAKKSSRRTINQFGLRNSLLLTLKYALLAREQGILDFTYQGTGRVDGRETLAFERRLPYTDEQGLWPDRVLVVHVDRELLLPTLCECYADDDKQVLLGRYKNSNIQLNVNLPDSVFTKAGMGL